MASLDQSRGGFKKKSLMREWQRKSYDNKINQSSLFKSSEVSLMETKVDLGQQKLPSNPFKESTKSLA